MTTRLLQTKLFTLVFSLGLGILGVNQANAQSNYFAGNRAGSNNQGENRNTFVGNFAGNLNTTGVSNSFFGSEAGFHNATGRANSFFGVSAGLQNTTGELNVYVGNAAGTSSNGSSNTFLGAYTANEIRFGDNNVFIGSEAAGSKTSGSNNVFLGNRAGAANLEGSNNVFLGYQAGLRERGSNKFIVSNNEVHSLLFGRFQTDNQLPALGIATEDLDEALNVGGALKLEEGSRAEEAGTIRWTGKDFEGFNGRDWKSLTRGNNLWLGDQNRMYSFPTAGVGIGTNNPQEKLHINGNVLANNFLVNSDKNYKENVAAIEGALEAISQIEGVSYSFKKEFSQKNFDDGKQLGFIAQNVKEVLPELVHEDSEGYLSVNYTGLIPVLTQALKEQNTKVSSLEERLAKVEALLSKEDASLKGSNKREVTSIAMVSSELLQNKPNPFTESTEIEFTIAEKANSAILYVYDLQGKQVREYSITEKGNTSVTLKAGSLQPGMYLYSLIVDGNEVDTKRMILTK